MFGNNEGNSISKSRNEIFEKNAYNLLLLKRFIKLRIHHDFFLIFLFLYFQHCTKMNFSVKDFFSKCDQIRRKLRIWSNLLKKSLTENFIFCAVQSEMQTVVVQEGNTFKLNISLAGCSDGAEEIFGKSVEKPLC